MTIEQAETYFAAYQELLNDEGKRGARRSPALLPTTKENLLRSIRLLIARLYFENFDHEDTLRPFVEAAMFLDSFTDQPLDSTDFVKSMQTRRSEVVGFYEDLKAIPPRHEFYWQRVYELLGISTETKRATFFERLKNRLGVHPATPPADPLAEPQ